MQVGEDLSRFRVKKMSNISEIENVARLVNYVGGNFLIILIGAIFTGLFLFALGGIFLSLIN